MIKGDLVWIPSNSRLIKFGPDRPTPSEWCTVKEPTYGVVLDEYDDVYVDVIYRGEKWTAIKSDLFEGTQGEEVAN
tara:strand:+ start:2242 stop:2469 length:228 start_codon:yes stop_codon:yes gene_type:complete